jgi:hypothetical protein
MKIGRNSETLLVVMVSSIILAYLVAFYLPSQGINILTFGQVIPSSSSSSTTTTTPCCIVCDTCPPCVPDQSPCPTTSSSSSSSSTSTTTQCCLTGPNLPPCPPDQTPCTTTTTTPPSGCAQSSPSIAVSPTSASANLGDVVNFTANVTNTDNSTCGSTTFAINSSFTLLNTASLFNFTATPNVFVLPPGQSQTVNVSAQAFSAFVGNYTVNTTVNISATDTSNQTHSGIASVSLNISESIFPLNFICNPIQNGPYRCGFDFASYSISSTNPMTIYFFVSNPKGKVVSNGGMTALITGAMNFNFHCSTFEPGTYIVSWFAYKASDFNLTNPISWSPTSADQTLKC